VLELILNVYIEHTYGIKHELKIRAAKPPDLARRLLVFRLFSWLKNLLVPGAGFEIFS
jgi:hypothetical protein